MTHRPLQIQCLVAEATVRPLSMPLAAPSLGARVLAALSGAPTVEPPARPLEPLMVHDSIEVKVNDSALVSYMDRQVGVAAARQFAWECDREIGRLAAIDLPETISPGDVPFEGGDYNPPKRRL